MHGYQIMQELSERTQGAWRPSAGSIYPTLQQLEDESLVEASEIEGKKVFALTVAGREAVSAGRPPWEQFESHGVHHDLRLAARGVAGAVMEVARTGTDDQAARVKEILEKARRDIYLLLAGDVTE